MEEKAGGEAHDRIERQEKVLLKGIIEAEKNDLRLLRNSLHSLTP